MEEVVSESEFLRRYRAGARRFVGLDINSDGTKSLEGACLDDVELIGCFCLVSFRGASLKGAVVHSNVKTCDFTNADLTGADFRDAALCATEFAGAKMDGADFTGAFNHSYRLTKGELPDW